MKCIDLAAVEEVDRDEMAKIIGGVGDPVFANVAPGLGISGFEFSLWVRGDYVLGPGAGSYAGQEEANGIAAS